MSHDNVANFSRWYAQNLQSRVLDHKHSYASSIPQNYPGIKAVVSSKWWIDYILNELSRLFFSLYLYISDHGICVVSGGFIRLVKVKRVAEGAQKDTRMQKGINSGRF